jgi:hypothetical protein
VYTPVVLLACLLLAFLPWAFVPSNDRGVSAAAAWTPTSFAG